MTAAHSIIIDTDPGQDDAIALLMALGARETIELIGITAVAGNVPLALTQANARKIVELSGRGDVPVIAGCSRPILRPLIVADHIHGKSGLDGADLPPPQLPLQPGHAVDFIVETLLERPAGTVTLCPIGPLTNIALAMIKQPEIIPRIREIVLMGGAIALGNVTPAAEFNIFVDPHAARVVFESGVKLTMLGLDVTHQALVTEARLAAVAAIPGRIGPIAAGLLDFFNRFDKNRYKSPGAPLHDPCVIAYLLRPELFSGRDCHVAVETDSEATMGATVVDWWHQRKAPANARVIDSIDDEGFFELVVDRLSAL